jgi:hypothetical protein
VQVLVVAPAAFSVILWAGAVCLFSSLLVYLILFFSYLLLLLCFFSGLHTTFFSFSLFLLFLNVPTFYMCFVSLHCQIPPAHGRLRLDLTGAARTALDSVEAEAAGKKSVESLELRLTYI